MKLINFMAEACHYAQGHIEGWDCGDGFDRELALQCTSYQMSCFLAQNTNHGSGGVESDIVIEELVEIPMKSIAEWKKILKKRVNELGGFKDVD